MAHTKGSGVMDIIHSHCVKNEVEGISRSDGTASGFFFMIAKGYHRQWDSRCFDYGKISVKISFINVGYWIEEFRLTDSVLTALPML
jgi:1,4-alpha-glucan branching enzyme